MKNYQKNYYLVLLIIAVIAPIIVWVCFDIQKTNKNYAKKHMYNDEYLIYPSDSTGKWNVLLANGTECTNLKPEQIALFLKSGEISSDTTWVIYPQCQYQLTIEDTTIILENFGRIVGRIPYNRAGQLSNLLIKDNE